MGIFKFIKGQPEPKQSDFGFSNIVQQNAAPAATPADSWADERKSECPNCGAVLKKVPQSKTKCPSCGEYMFVRKDPRTRSERVVTAQQVEEILDVRAKMEGWWPQRQAEKQRWLQIHDSLRRKWNAEPSPEDIQWELWNQDLIAQASKREWGLYRNTLHEMAKVAKKRGKLSDALMLFLDVIYLDGCGPSNDGAPWQKSERMYLSYFADEVAKLCVKLNLNHADLPEKYARRATHLQTGLRLPRTFFEVWNDFKADPDIASII